MNYIELINRFWLTNEAHLFRTTDIALFFYLLKINNACSWKEYFKRKNIQIQADLNISYNTLKEARNRLKQANLLDFKSKNGSGDVLYTLSKFDEVTDKVNSSDLTLSKNDEVTDEVTNEVGCEVTNEVDLARNNGTCNKTKPNKTKEDSLNIGETDIPVAFLEKSLDDCYKELASNVPWLETICMNTRSGEFRDFSMDDLIKQLQCFFMKLQNEGNTVKSPRDAQAHFARWLNIELKKQRDDRTRANAFGWPAKTAGTVIQGKTGKAAGLQSGSKTPKDYSGSF